MATMLINTGVKFPDNSVQTSAYAGQGTTANVQTFDTTGTWTKPTGGQSMARIQVWGGGGGGGSASVGIPFAGAGGGYMELTVPLSILPSTVAVTVGSGGAGATVVNTAGGAAGGTSIFPLGTTYNSLDSVRATGGNSVFIDYGNGSQGAGGTPLNAAGQRSLPGDWWGSFDGFNFDQSYASNGTPASYGGASGGHFGYYASSASGATSLFGGAGGGVTITSTGGYGTAGNGQAPGGGGSAGGSGWVAGRRNGGNGGAGRVIVTCW